MPSDQQLSLAKWMRSLAIVLGTSEIPLHTVEILLRIAHADLAGEGTDSQQLIEATGLSSSAISRNIAHLGDYNYRDKPGMGLLSATPEYADRRRKRLRLTPKGRQVISLIDHLSREAKLGAA